MKEIQQQLIEQISTVLEQYRFRYIACRELFVNTVGEKSFRFQVRCLRAKGGLLIEPAVGVRIEVVEKIFHRTSGFEPEYQQWTPTLGAEIWRLEGDPTAFQYPLTRTEDIAGVAKHLITDFQTKALDYYTEYSSLQSIDQVLNHNPSEKTPHRMMEWLRASTGLIVARLVDRRNYNELTNVYLKTLHKLDRGFYLPQFTALIKDLHDVEPLPKSSLNDCPRE